MLDTPKKLVEGLRCIISPLSPMRFVKNALGKRNASPSPSSSHTLPTLSASSGSTSASGSGSASTSNYTSTSTSTSSPSSSIHTTRTHSPTPHRGRPHNHNHKHRPLTRETAIDLRLSPFTLKSPPNRATIRPPSSAGGPSSGNATGNGNGLRVPYALRAARQIKGQSKRRGVKKELGGKELGKGKEKELESGSGNRMMLHLREVVDVDGHSSLVEGRKPLFGNHQHYAKPTSAPAPAATTSSASSSSPSTKPAAAATPSSSSKPTPMSRALQYKPVKVKVKVESGDEGLGLGVVTKETATERARRLKREGKRPISVSNPLPTPPASTSGYRTSVTPTPPHPHHPHPHSHRSPYPSPYLPSVPASASAYPPSREHELERECQRLGEQALAVQREAQAAEQLAQQLFASQQQQARREAQHEAVDAERVASLKREESFRAAEALRVAEKKLEAERVKHRAAVEAIGREYDDGVRERERDVEVLKDENTRQREDLDKWSRMCGTLDDHLARHIAMAGFVNQVYTAGGPGGGSSASLVSLPGALPSHSLPLPLPTPTQTLPPTLPPTPQMPQYLTLPPTQHQPQHQPQHSQLPLGLGLGGHGHGLGFGRDATMAAIPSPEGSFMQDLSFTMGSSMGSGFGADSSMHLYEESQSGGLQRDASMASIGGMSDGSFTFEFKGDGDKDGDVEVGGCSDTSMSTVISSDVGHGGHGLGLGVGLARLPSVIMPLAPALEAAERVVAEAFYPTPSSSPPDSVNVVIGVDSTPVLPPLGLSIQLPTLPPPPPLPSSLPLPTSLPPSLPPPPSPLLPLLPRPETPPPGHLTPDIQFPTTNEGWINRYNERWEKWREADVKRAPGEPCIEIWDVPWPMFGPVEREEDLEDGEVKRFFRGVYRMGVESDYLDKDKNKGGVRGVKTVKKMVREEMLRWHPDKFESRALGYIHRDQHEMVMAMARRISCVLNSLEQ